MRCATRRHLLTPRDIRRVGRTYHRHRGQRGNARRKQTLHSKTSVKVATHPIASAATYSELPSRLVRKSHTRQPVLRYLVSNSQQRNDMISPRFFFGNGFQEMNYRKKKEKGTQNFPNGTRGQQKTPDDAGFFRRMREASEVIVHTKAQVARLQTIVDAGDRVGTAAEIHIEIFNLRRPVLRKAILQANTAGPADESLAFRETA